MRPPAASEWISSHFHRAPINPVKLKFRNHTIITPLIFYLKNGISYLLKGRYISGMNRVSLKVSLTICSIVVFACASFAQSFYSVRNNRTLILSGGTGTSTYFGELQNPGDIIDAKPTLNVGLQYFLTSRFSVRGEVTWFQLAGSDAKADDEGRKPRNLSFQSNNFEISTVGTFAFLPQGPRFYQRPIFNPYAFAGIGLLWFNPTAEYNGTRYALAPLMTEGVKYNRTQVVVPFGLGARLKATPFFNIVVEGGYRITFTDYLDDVSTRHPDKSTWTDPIRIALSDRKPEIDGTPSKVGGVRGNPDSNDGYFLLNAKIEYYLPTNFLVKKRRYGSYRRRR